MNNAPRASLGAITISRSPYLGELLVVALIVPESRSQGPEPAVGVMGAGSKPSADPRRTINLADKWGRLNVSCVGAFAFLLGVVLQIATQQLSAFLIGRAIAGFGQGLWLGNIVVYAENHIYQNNCLILQHMTDMDS